jgi:hypothetical protein
MTNAVDEMIERPLTYIRDHARPYAEAKASRVYLEQFRKSKKALLMIEAEQKSVKTIAEREAYAYAHNDYLALLDGLRVAVAEEERLKMQITAAQLRIELYRTEQANQRIERKGYGA